jgi:RNA polymerase sigma-70 factor (ECF subfamily)
MEWALARNGCVNEAIAEPVPTLARPTETDTFESLYERTFPKLYAYVASLVGDRAAAEDVTAQAYERAYRRRRTYRAARGSREAWIFGIARNAALDELRRRRRSARLEGEPADTAAPTLDDQTEHALRRAAVRAALETLELREREIVALKFVGGLSNTEIAGVLGVSESNAGTRLHRAITKLREACHDRA